MTDTAFRKQFLDKICGWDWALALVFGVNTVLLVMLGLTLWLGPEEEGAKVISAVSLVVILATMGVVGTLLRLCKRRSTVDPATTDE